MAADYYRAMAVAERRLALDESANDLTSISSEILALVDTLEEEPLDDEQRKAVKDLRMRILSLADF